jgi:hypothetical protein
METHPDELDLSETEEDALHELQLSIEHVHRAYGQLLQFHHGLGHAMDRMNDAEAELREAGHEERANQLRDDHLPAGAIDDRWTFELVEAFSGGFFADVTDFERDVRDELADGTGHVTERRQKLQMLERADD